MTAQDCYDLALKKLEAAERFWASKNPKDREKGERNYQEALSLREQFLQLTNQQPTQNQ
jgi:hypothetical protein